MLALGRGFPKREGCGCSLIHSRVRLCWCRSSYCSWLSTNAACTSKFFRDLSPVTSDQVFVLEDDQPPRAPTKAFNFEALTGATRFTFPLLVAFLQINTQFASEYNMRSHVTYFSPHPACPAEMVHVKKMTLSRVNSPTAAPPRCWGSRRTSRRSVSGGAIVSRGGYHDGRS